MQIMAHDPRFRFTGRDNSFPDAVVVREIWCENVYEVFDGDLSDTGIVVDIGANIGSFSLYGAKLGAKKVIAVEPEPHNLELLRKNIDDNKQHVPDCDFVIDEHGVAGRKGLALITDAHGDSRVVENGDEEANNASSIRLITIADLWKAHNLEFVDVLKIDIEGLEGEVILDAPTALLNLCRYITIEYDRRASDLGAIINKLIETHQVKVVGKAGGMIFAKRY